jgi:hypothetical protein
MIDCRTEHGQWLHEPSGQQLKKITRYTCDNPVCVFTNEPDKYLCWWEDIKFFTNGKYTGFRLKSLK